VVSGPWQMITLAAALLGHDQASMSGPALEDRRLAFFNRHFSDEIREVMLQIAASLGGPLQAVWIDDLLATSAVSQAKSFGAIVESLRARIGQEEFDEIWINSVRDWPEAFICAAFPTAKVFLYEDGLATYFAGSPVDKFSLRDLLTRPAFRKTMIDRVRRAFSFSSSEVLQKMRSLPRSLPERVTGASLYLYRRFPLPPDLDGRKVTDVTPDHLRTVIQLVQKNAVFAGGLIEPRQEGVLFLAQTFSEAKYLLREQEEGIYRTVTRRLVEKGCIVYWKDHPRAKEPFFPQMMSEFGAHSVRQIKTPAAFPIELSLQRHSFQCCVGGTSTSLCYLPDLFEIPSFQFAHNMIPDLHGGTLEMAQAFAKIIPESEKIEAGKLLEHRLLDAGNASA
jgi:hypothetical protein